MTALYPEAVMEFNAAFVLLKKFTVGLAMPKANASEMIAVSQYLGIALPDAGLDERIAFLSKELSRQNGFLSVQLESEEIYQTDEYRKSFFIREVVANNRINRGNRLRRRQSGNQL